MSSDSPSMREALEQLNVTRVEQQQTDSVPKIRATVQSMKNFSKIEQRRLVLEFAEIQGASAEIFRYMREIEVLTHRMLVCAPTYTASSERLKKFVEQWSQFTMVNWDVMFELSVQDNPLGA